jgi:signal transduction histidine kinase
MMAQIWDFLSTEGFQPHGFCLLWRPDIFWTHVTSDAVIALSYFSIPAALFYLAVKRSDLIYRWVLYLFAAFIVACGLTHLFGIWTLWVPDYGLQALLKLVTALVSVVTAATIWPLMPRLLAMPSAGQLAEKNAALAHEVTERQAAEVQLQTLNEDLEKRVAERTATLEEVNRELLRSRAEAEQASRAKSDFLAMMSHELRTPLNAILGFSDIIRTKGAGTDTLEKDREYAAHIHESGRHLLDLITDILDLSKIESGQERLNEEAIDVEDLVAATLTVTSTAAERNDVALAVDLPANCPALYADPLKLKQILINLLSNAVKFTPAEGQVTLTVRPDGPGGYLFQVADNGIGIAPEDLPRALAPFQQVDDSLERTHEGTGLGLPLTKALAEMHGGSLQVESAPGSGTMVTVCFPRERRLCDGASAPQAGMTSNCTAPGGRICPWRQPSTNTCGPQTQAPELPCGPARKR